MPFWALLLLAFPVLAIVAVIFTVYQSVISLSQPGAGIRPVTREEFPRNFEDASALEPWAARNGFEFCGGYRLEVGAPVFVAAWRKPGKSEFLLEYQAAMLKHYDRVSLFDREHGLTTSTSKDAQFLPQPIGTFVQCFPGVELDKLMAHHAEGTEYLMREYQLSREYVEAEIAPLVNESVARQMRYIRSIPFWPLRGPWWYFVNRETMKGQPVSVLYPPNTEVQLSESA